VVKGEKKGAADADPLVENRGALGGWMKCTARWLFKADRSPRLLSLRVGFLKRIGVRGSFGFGRIVWLGKDGSVVLSRGRMFSHEAIEWPEEVEVLVDRLENEAAEGRKLSREERAVMDVYETVALLEGEDGLHGFWHSEVNHQRIINSFELIGATTLVDPLNASRWCETRPEDRYDYSETEEETLSNIEEELFEGMDELVDLVLAFMEEELG
jgi:hypothetical protein